MRDIRLTAKSSRHCTRHDRGSEMLLSVIDIDATIDELPCWLVETYELVEMKAAGRANGADRDELH